MTATIRILLFIGCLGAMVTGSAQSNKEDYQLTISRTEEVIQVDGELSEQTWAQAEVAEDFWQKSPRDDIKADNRTEARMAYNDQMLYIAFKCHDPESGHIVQTLKRDESFWDNDGVAVILDPIGEATFGFFFAINTQGAQNEALLGGGTGDDQYSDEWNNKWYAETAIHDGFWTAEIAIPFKTIRYDPSNKNWGINFARQDAKNNQLHVWARIPRQFWPIDLGYAGKLQWDQNPPAAKGNVSIIPYISAGITNDFEKSQPSERSLGVGLDAKIAINSSLNLDLTINPDFSQVEVDQQVTNLTRFSIFFPERRNFFLENSDLFANFGDPLLRPFFSRRIGLSDDGQPVPIQFGTRLSGNINDNLRIGIMDVHTGSKGADVQAQNYFTAAFSQRLFGRTRLNGIVINRQGFQGTETIKNDYGRNVGSEFVYQSQDGKWLGWGTYHLSIQPGIQDENVFSSIGAQYAGNRFNTVLALASVGTNFYADVGFVNRIFQYNAETDESIRQGYKYFFLPMEYTIVPENTRKFQQMNFGMENFILFNPAYQRTESNHAFNYQVEFTNSSGFEIGVQYTDVNLQYPFSFTEEVPLPVDRYRFTSYGMEYRSDQRKLFNYQIGFQTGGFYNGSIHQIELALNYRRQPWGQFSMQGQYNDLKFPDEFGETQLWLIGPRMEFAFSRDLFWSTFIQYNTQAENFNLNSRFQWQFQPLSWIYLVYTDNYLTSNWAKKNRALVFKINYWLTV